MNTVHNLTAQHEKVSLKQEKGRLSQTESEEEEVEEEKKGKKKNLKDGKKGKKGGREEEKKKKKQKNPKSDTSLTQSQFGNLPIPQEVSVVGSNLF